MKTLDTLWLNAQVRNSSLGIGFYFDDLARDCLDAPFFIPAGSMMQATDATLRFTSVSMRDN